MVLAQHPTIADQGVLIQVAGSPHLTQLAQVDGEVGGGDKGVEVVISLQAPLPSQGFLVQIARCSVFAH